MTIKAESISPALAIDLPAISRDALNVAIREATKDIDTAAEWLAAEEKTLADICQGNPLAPGGSIRMNHPQRGDRSTLEQPRVPGRHVAA